MADFVVDLPAYDIRYTEPSDQETLMKWVSDERVLKWFPMDLENEVRLMVTNWVAFAKYKASLTALYDNTPVGIVTLFLMPYRKISHLAIVYLAVDPDFENRGVATSLIKNIKNLGKNYFRLRSIHFEIMIDSPLKRILEKEGFKEIIYQEDFFKRGDQLVARVVMEADL